MDVAKVLKEQLDAHTPGTCWHVIVGKQFGSYVTNERKKYVCCSFGVCVCVCVVVESLRWSECLCNPRAALLTFVAMHACVWRGHARARLQHRAPLVVSHTTQTRIILLQIGAISILVFQHG